jgi:hypothetical protein
MTVAAHARQERLKMEEMANRFVQALIEGGALTGKHSKNQYDGELHGKKNARSRGPTKQFLYIYFFLPGLFTLIPELGGQKTVQKGQNFS